MTLTEPAARVPAPARQPERRPRTSRSRRPNIPSAVAGLVWLVVVLVPVYWLVVSSLRGQAGFLGGNQWLPPSHPTLQNYQQVLASGFWTYLRNSVVITAAAVCAVLLAALMAAYVILHSRRRIATGAFRLILAGLAIPSHAVIIPIYLIITRLKLYDSLTALVLPTAAFAIPMAVLVTVGFLRDIPRELHEAMRLDGAGDLRILRSLVAPLSRPAMVTAGIYTAIQAWNGFLFPLILTQSPGTRVLPLSLWTFEGEFTIDVPAVLAAVALSCLPLFAAYLVGRRHLIAGLTAGFGR
jgi:raffinose/stachyose/melibiose transport system permease protein